MLPFELVATATDSPRYSPAGSLRKFAAEVKGISFTPVIVAFCWATAGPATRTTAVHAEARYRFMERPLPRSDDCPVRTIVLAASCFGRCSRGEPIPDASAVQYHPRI